MRDAEPPVQAPAVPPPAPVRRSLDESLLCLRFRFWWFITLFQQSFLLILMVSCLSTPKWVKQGDYLYQWEGGVVMCTTCEDMECQGCGSFDNKAYSDLKDDSSCDASDIAKSFCKAFDDLSSAGGVYFFFEMMSMSMLIVWILQVAFLLLAKQCFSRMRWLAYVFPALTLLFHLVGLIIWAGVSEAKFDGDCENSSFDGGKPDICATNGPALAVVTVLICAIAVGVFLFALVKSVVPAEKDAEADKQQPRLSDDPLAHESPRWQGSPSNANQAGFRPEGSPRQPGFTPFEANQEYGAQGPYSDYGVSNKA